MKKKQKKKNLKYKAWHSPHVFVLMDDEVLGRGVHGQLQWVAGDPMDVRLHMVGLLQDEVQEKHYWVEERCHQVDKHKILQVGEHGLAERKKKPEPLLALKM